MVGAVYDYGLGTSRHEDATAVHVLANSHRYELGLPRNLKRGFALELRPLEKDSLKLSSG